jgi:hypothetical protein
MNLNLNLKVSEPLQKNNIVVFFLSSVEKSNNNYLTFSEALKQELVDVSEVNEKGAISMLRLTNKSSQGLLILGGEQVIGNKLKQNRIVSHSVLIPAHSTPLIKVNCGEQYRWSSSVNADLSVSESLYFSRRNLGKGKQFKVWGEIDDKLKELDVKSLTSSVHEIYKKRKNSSDEIASFFKAGDFDVAVAIGVNNNIRSLDIFSSNLMLKKYLKKLIRGVAINSFRNVNHKSFLTEKDAYKFLRMIRESNQQEFKVEEGTLGKRIQFNGELVSGNALSNSNEILHCSAFLKEHVAAGPEKVYNVA